MSKKISKVCEVEGKEGTYLLVRRCRENSRVRPLNTDGPGETVPTASLRNERPHEDPTAQPTADPATPSTTPEPGTSES